MQKVYFEEQHYLGDDETTIIFTNNATRIVANIERESNEDDNESVKNNENNDTTEYERLSIELPPTFEGMIKEIMNLPDDNEAWSSYMNPTMYFFGIQTPLENLLERETQHVMDFKNWLDGTLFVNHEFKERTKFNHLTPSPQDKTIQVATVEENNLSKEMNGEQGSSSVNEKPLQEITWGTRKTTDNEEELNSCLRTNIPNSEKKNGDKNVESNLEEMTLCSICDYEDSDEYEEEEDSTLPYLDGEDIEDANSTVTEDNDFHNAPVVIALSGPASDNYEQEEEKNNSDNYEQEEEKTNSDNDEDSIEILFNEIQEEQQQHASSESTSTFTTPFKKSTKSILEILRQATQKRLQLPTFDVATAFLNESKDFVLKKESDDIAFLIGPRKDGIIKHHQLSPIPLHDNPYQPIFMQDEVSVTFRTDTPLEGESSSDYNENEKQVNKKKQKKKASSSKTSNTRENFDFDFNDEGYTLALFQTGGEEMRNDYEINKRKRSPSPASSTDSKSSLEIFYKAQRTYPPEVGESNAESVERSRLVEQKIQQLKEQHRQR
jgi:hypothetical protein